MAQSPAWQQFLEAGMHFTALTRSEAQRRARELVREGQLAQERVQAFVEELLDTSRKRADEFVDAVRHEVERQLKVRGVASRLPGRRPGPVKAAKNAKKSAKKPAKKAKKAAKVAKKSAKSAKKTARDSSTKKSAAKKTTKAAKKSASATKQSP